MTLELGQSDDPVALVPGSPSSLHARAAEWQRAATAAEDVAQAIEGIAVPDGWTGEAASAFTARLKSLPAVWSEYADACGKAAVILMDYADSLIVAQSQAAEAIAKWNHGERETARAHRETADATKRFWMKLPGPAAGIPIFVDFGAAHRKEAQEILSNARTIVRDEGDAAAGRLSRVTENAPSSPNMWAAGAAVIAVMWKLQSERSLEAGADVLNGVASFGNALIKHPDVLLEMLLGVAGMAGGVGLIGGGGAGTVFSVGTASAVTVPAIAGGVTLAGAGATAIGHAAARAGERRCQLVEATSNRSYASRGV